MAEQFLQVQDQCRKSGGLVTKRNEGMCAMKDTDKNSLIHNSPKLGTIQTSVNQGMDKQIVVHYSNEMLCYNENRLLIHMATWSKLTDKKLSDRS